MFRKYQVSILRGNLLHICEPKIPDKRVFEKSKDSKELSAPERPKNDESDVLRHVVKSLSPLIVH